jgi:AcrR family transcriptional regulator
MVAPNRPGRWPTGRPPIPQEFIYERKRERCAVAIGEIVREVGAERLTVAAVTQRARVSRATFYSLFAGQEDAFRYACELGNRRLREAVEGAAGESDDRRERVGRVLEALVGAAKTVPSLAELCLANGCGRADPGGAPSDIGLAEALVAVLEEGGGARGRSGAELATYGILSVLARRLRQGDRGQLDRLCGPLTEFAIAQAPDRP